MNDSFATTPLSLDAGTLSVLDHLAEKWSVSKAEVMRRAICKAKEDAESEYPRASPLQAIEWLQSGGGLTSQQNTDFKESIQAERDAKRYWWES